MKILMQDKGFKVTELQDGRYLVTIELYHAKIEHVFADYDSMQAWIDTNDFN